jgi:uroporphyrinogen III methyltransferase/synthase
LKLACIGPATAAALEGWRLKADLVPESYRAESLAAALKAQVRGKSILWARASRGRDVLPSELRKAGATVEELVVYRNDDAASLPEGVVHRWEAGELDWIGLSSPSIARNLVHLMSTASRQHLGVTTRIAAISPVTAEAAHTVGLPVHAVAESFTWDGLFEAIVAAEATRQSRR